ncbi:GNAT family N-acetyltransferase [Paenibacillus sp. GCM10023248]|uniref:GNAT family N-acetyltransferase n=1 Tax=Bacillales TaxID=1385 RepID=UPI0023784164|nr:MULTISPECIES: GNAT family N-acetyltransferase [Bacillales]MDD9268082.1 GNAT family N-acetyltransferase [Paenibacillus sp. MAHUQ-63]MDR6879757.1 ribosomal protein S18 acetylase RimI-like enzyme [Bacillus sp. 3255]
MIFKKMSELSVNEAVALWNLGFEGYFINSTLNVDRFLARAVAEGLSMELSLAMYDTFGDPVGLVMNGFRTIDGRKIAWNGGTGIAPAFRGKGYGQQLMERNLELYREQGAAAALLEALIQNDAAIRLYQKVGYEITERLLGLQHEGTLHADILGTNRTYDVKRGRPVEVKELPFYRPMSAWQTQWTSLRDGESIIVTDGDAVVGYALCKRVYAEDSSLATIVLYQCEASPGRGDEREIMRAALREVFEPGGPSCKRLTLNLRHSNQELAELLTAMGFTSYVTQVHMLRQM